MTYEITETTRPAVWSRNFTRLWWGETVSFFGSQLTIFALPIVALEAFDVSTFEVTLINTAAGIGTLAFAAFFSPWADSSHRHRVMVALNVFRLAVVAVVAAGLIFHYLTMLVVLSAALLLAGATVIYESAFSAMVPLTVERRGLTRANTWVGGMQSVANVGAGGVAGILIQALGPASLFVTDLVSYAVAAFCVGGVRVHNEAKAPRRSIGEYFGTLGVGFRFLWRDKLQRAIVLGITHFNFFTTALQALYVVYLIRYVGLSIAEVGIGASLGGVIGVLGVLIAPRLLDRARLGVILAMTFALPAGCALAFLALPGLDKAASMIVLALILGGWAILVLVNITATESIKQSLVPNEMLGRFSSAARILTWGVDPLGAAFGGLLTVFLSIEFSLAILAIGIATSCLWTLNAGVIHLPRFPRLIAEGDASAEIPAGIVHTEKT